MQTLFLLGFLEAFVPGSEHGLDTSGLHSHVLPYHVRLCPSLVQQLADILLNPLPRYRFSH